MALDRFRDQHAEFVKAAVAAGGLTNLPAKIRRARAGDALFHKQRACTQQPLQEAVLDTCEKGRRGRAGVTYVGVPSP